MIEKYLRLNCMQANKKKSIFNHQENIFQRHFYSNLKNVSQINIVLNTNAKLSYVILYFVV